MFRIYTCMSRNVRFKSFKKVKKSDISENICYKITDQLDPTCFALQVAEATHVTKDARVITYVRYVLKNVYRRIFCFENMLMLKLRQCTRLSIF